MPDHPTTSAERLIHHELPGRADADIRPTRERYYPLDRPIPEPFSQPFDGSKCPTYVGLPPCAEPEEAAFFPAEQDEPTVDELMAGPVATYEGPCQRCGSPIGVAHAVDCPTRLAYVGAHRAFGEPATDAEAYLAATDPVAAARARAGALTALPTSAVARKMLPLATGLLDYFPAALVAVAGLSRVGNEQHNPGQPLHWDRSKSGDEADALLRHFVERGTYDTDGLRHSTKVAWRALALLQKELEDAGLAPLSRGSR